MTVVHKSHKCEVDADFNLNIHVLTDNHTQQFFVCKHSKLQLKILLRLSCTTLKLTPGFLARALVQSCCSEIDSHQPVPATKFGFLVQRISLIQDGVKNRISCCFSERPYEMVCDDD